jgi:hypothetical protein
MVPCCICEWSIGVGTDWLDGCVAAFAIGMIMPLPFFADADGFFDAAFFFADFLVAVAFLTVGFFFAAGFAGIGMVMPGMFICAAAGAETVASASALAANKNAVFTNTLQKEAPPRSSASPTRN